MFLSHLLTVIFKNWFYFNKQDTLIKRETKSRSKKRRERWWLLMISISWEIEDRAKRGKGECGGHWAGSLWFVQINCSAKFEKSSNWNYSYFFLFLMLFSPCLCHSLSVSLFLFPFFFHSFFLFTSFLYLFLNWSERLTNNSSEPEGYSLLL